MGRLARMTDPLHETGRVSITAGMVRAMALHGAARQCPSCKLGIPKYPGRYPGKCPRCGESMAQQAMTESVSLESRAHNLNRLLSESERIQRSDVPFFGDDANSRFLLIPYDLIEEYGGVDGFKVWLEGPVGTIQDEPAYYRVESMEDPVLVFTFLDERERARAFATNDPTRYLGFDPRAEMVNEDHDATFLAEDVTREHGRVAGFFVGEDQRASIYRRRKPGEGRTQVRGGFRIHVGHNQDRKPRKDIARSLQNKVNQRRGIRGRVQAAKKWHQSHKGQELHKALARYNRSRSRNEAEAHDAALRSKLVDTLDRIKRYNSAQQRSPVHEDIGTLGTSAVGGGSHGASQIEQPTVEDNLEGVLRKLIVSNDLDVLQDVHFDERDGSMYLFFDPVLMLDEIQEILEAVRKERGDIALIASPTGILDNESVESLWWVLFAPGAMSGEPDPSIFAARPEDHYTKAQMVSKAPPAPPEAIAQNVNISKLIKAAGENR